MTKQYGSDHPYPSPADAAAQSPQAAYFVAKEPDSSDVKEYPRADYAVANDSNAPAVKQANDSDEEHQGTSPNGAQDAGASVKPINRLRKACDSCSIRKVKCDETCPCKACVALDIPCTFERPSKRRGPPNRLAQSIKKQRLEHSPIIGSAGQSIPSSPGGTLHSIPTSVAPREALSAEAICPWPTLQLLIDDYFTFIHPLIPLPHEPSFRNGLRSRQDVTNTTFLALLAAMLATLTASFPRRVRQHLKSHNMDQAYPSSMSLVERCLRVAAEANCAAPINRQMILYDAVTCYLNGLTNLYTFHRQPAILCWKQCLAIITTLGMHKWDQRRGTTTARTSASSTPSDHQQQLFDGPSCPPPDLIELELGKRLFWIWFAGERTFRQLGLSPFELSVPPSTRRDPYPPLPLEVDDAYITPSLILAQPEGHMSALVGFNRNIEIFRSYNKLALNELNHGVDELFNWDQQEREIHESLSNVKRILERLPLPFRLEQPAHPASKTDVSVTDPESEISDTVLNSPALRSQMQREIQRANIHATQLGTRSYLVERYLIFREMHEKKQSKKSFANSNSNTASSKSYPGSPLSSTNTSVASAVGTTSDATISAEYSAIISSLLTMLSTSRQISMEANGASLIAKVRAIATTLLDAGAAGAPMPTTAPSSQDETAQHAGAKEYMHAFVNVLSKLEKTIGVGPNNCDAAGKGGECDEERALREWADLRVEQARFLAEGGYLSRG